MGKLELVVMAGSESKAFLASLTEQLDRLEKLHGVMTGKKVATSITEDAEETTETDEEEELIAPVNKTATKKAAASFDDEEVHSDDDEEEAPVAKKTKAKKVTLDDVNDACKARAASVGGKEGRSEVLTILKKKFKTTSVSELKPEQYAAVIAAMEVE